MYLTIQRLQNWNNAKLFCKQIGGKLAEIKSATENARARQAAYGSPWIGITDSSKEGDWKWVFVFRSTFRKSLSQYIFANFVSFPVFEALKVSESLLFVFFWLSFFTYASGTAIVYKIGCFFAEERLKM